MTGSGAGKRAVVTGATRGIGEETALGLARLGYHLALVARDPVRGEATLARLREANPGGRHALFVADLGSLADVRRLGGALATAFPRLDVLVNNAGAMHTTRKVTADGFETTFAVNHLAPFLLTTLLEPALRAAAPSRVVTVASEAHRMGGALDFDDLQAERGYRALAVYGRSKLANILFSNELARRLAGTGVTSNALHPGVVATGFGRNDPGFMAFLVRLGSAFMITPEKGARTSIHVASAPALAAVSGRYFKDSREARPAAVALDEAAARRLWETSARLVAGG